MTHQTTTEAVSILREALSKIAKWRLAAPAAQPEAKAEQDKRTRDQQWRLDELRKSTTPAAAAAELIAAFESIMEGCSNQSWLEYQNGNGENVGKRIDAARHAYYSWPVTASESSLTNGQCDECGKKQSDGWALYCLSCFEKVESAKIEPIDGYRDGSYSAEHIEAVVGKPAASDSVDTTEFLGMAIAAVSEAVSIGPGEEWEGFIAHINAWHATIKPAAPDAAAVRDKALLDAIAVVPGGSVCDPQQVADAIRALRSPLVPQQSGEMA